MKQAWQHYVQPIQEDEALLSLVTEHGSTHWSRIAKLLQSAVGGSGCTVLPRSGKQCRERYVGYLAPTISTAQWSKHEVDTILSYHEQLGNRWAQIAQHLPGRSAIAVKNLVYGTVRRNLRRLNRYQPREEHLQGSLNKLLNDPEMRKFLLNMHSPSLCTRPRRNAQLTQDSLDSKQLENSQVNEQIDCIDKNNDLAKAGPAENENPTEAEHLTANHDIFLDALMEDDCWVLGGQEYWATQGLFELA